jgi:hypothetical protein
LVLDILRYVKPFFRSCFLAQPKGKAHRTLYGLPRSSFREIKEVTGMSNKIIPWDQQESLVAEKKII